jgi:hypothetical protein
MKGPVVVAALCLGFIVTASPAAGALRFDPPIPLDGRFGAVATAREDVLLVGGPNFAEDRRTITIARKPRGSAIETLARFEVTGHSGFAANEAGDAAFAYARDGQLFVSRREPSGAMSVPDVVGNVGNFEMVRVGIDDAGAPAVLWSESTNDALTLRARIRPAGAGWSAPLLVAESIKRDAFTEGFVVLPGNEALAIVDDGTVMANSVRSDGGRSATRVADRVPGSCRRDSVVESGNGHVAVISHTGQGGCLPNGSSVVATRAPDRTWSAPRPVEDAVGIGTGAMDGSGRLTFAFGAPANEELGTVATGPFGGPWRGGLRISASQGSDAVALAASRSGDVGLVTERSSYGQPSRVAFRHESSAWWTSALLPDCSTFLAAPRISVGPAGAVAVTYFDSVGLQHLLVGRPTEDPPPDPCPPPAGPPASTPSGSSGGAPPSPARFGAPRLRARGRTVAVAVPVVCRMRCRVGLRARLSLGGRRVGHAQRAKRSFKGSRTMRLRFRVAGTRSLRSASAVVWADARVSGRTVRSVLRATR